MPGIPGFEQVPRYRELVDRLLAEDAEFLPPGFILELDRPEWAFLKREELWSSGPMPVAAAVGNFSRAQIINPANSGRIVVVKRFRCQSVPAAGSFDVSTDGARIVAGQISNTALDLRWPLNAAVTARGTMSVNAVANNLPATSGIIVERVTNGGAAASDLLTETGPWVLPPNTNIEATLRVPNTATLFVAWGYERAARAEELAN